MKQSSHPRSQDFFRVQQLSVYYDGHAVVDNVSFSINRGEIVTIIGPNGSGKTTLARVLIGFVTPQRGRILAEPRLRMSYVPQNISLNPLIPMSGERFLQLGPFYNQGMKKSLLNRLRLQDIRTRQFAVLSGGEKQRLLLARALLNAPQLLILDEPAQALDVDAQMWLYELVRDYAQENNCAVILISHDLHLVMSSTDRVLCMHNHICCSGTPREISNHPNYKQLFRPEVAKHLAIYSHKHKHTH